VTDTDVSKLHLRKALCYSELTVITSHIFVINYCNVGKKEKQLNTQVFHQLEFVFFEIAGSPYQKIKDCG